jgi:hypothetical protein
MCCSVGPRRMIVRGSNSALVAVQSWTLTASRAFEWLHPNGPDVRGQSRRLVETRGACRRSSRLEDSLTVIDIYVAPTLKR